MKHLLIINNGTQRVIQVTSLVLLPVTWTLLSFKHRGADITIVVQSSINNVNTTLLGSGREPRHSGNHITRWCTVVHVVAVVPTEDIATSIRHSTIY